MNSNLAKATVKLYDLLEINNFLFRRVAASSSSQFEFYLQIVSSTKSQFSVYSVDLFGPLQNAASI